MAAETNHLISIRDMKWVLQMCVENGGLILMVYVEQFKQNILLKLDDTWTIHGANEEENGVYSFLASPEDSQRPLRFVVHNPAQQREAESWLEYHKFWMRSGLSSRSQNIRNEPRIMPPRVVFIEGVTDYVPGCKQRELAI